MTVSLLNCSPFFTIWCIRTTRTTTAADAVWRPPLRRAWPSRPASWAWTGTSWGAPSQPASCRPPRQRSNYLYQRVTKRCRLSWLTNSALVIRVQMRGEGWGSCGVSANEYSCAHHVTWSPNKLCRSTSIFNLWFVQICFVVFQAVLKPFLSSWSSRAASLTLIICIFPR